MIKDWNDKLLFGKYSGKTVQEIYDLDASYLAWVMKNTTRTLLPREIEDKIKLKAKEEDDKFYAKRKF